MIEKYIQFAIDNGYTGFDKYWPNHTMDIYEFEWRTTISIDDDGLMCLENIEATYIITSKPFIEAIARWLEKTKDELWAVVIHWDDMVEHYHFDHWEVYHWNDVENLRVLIRDITVNQAIAIYNGTLEELYDKILPKQ